MKDTCLGDLVLPLSQEEKAEVQRESLHLTCRTVQGLALGASSPHYSVSRSPIAFTMLAVESHHLKVIRAK